jgi:hypothetical protein
MTPNSNYLALIATFTRSCGLYILNVLGRNKLADAVGYPSSPLVLSPWARTAEKAHYTTPLRIWPHLPPSCWLPMPQGEQRGHRCGAAYWAACALRAVCYTGAPWLRTLSFAVAWGGIICIAGMC